MSVAVVKADSGSPFDFLSSISSWFSSFFTGMFAASTPNQNPTSVPSDDTRNITERLAAEISKAPNIDPDDPEAGNKLAEFANKKLIPSLHEKFGTDIPAIGSNEISQINQGIKMSKGYSPILGHYNNLVLSAGVVKKKYNEENRNKFYTDMVTFAADVASLQSGGLSPLRLLQKTGLKGGIVDKFLPSSSLPLISNNLQKVLQTGGIGNTSAIVQNVGNLYQNR